MVVLEKIKREIKNELISCNGTDDTFTTTYDFKDSSLKIHINGQRLAKDIDYVITGSDTFRIVYYIPKSYFILLVDYEIAY